MNPTKERNEEERRLEAFKLLVASLEQIIKGVIGFRDAIVDSKKNMLHDHNYSDIFMNVNKNFVLGEPKSVKEGIAELNFDFSENHTVIITLDNKRVFLHRCKSCFKTFDSIKGRRHKCPHCGTTNWPTGETEWDRRRKQRDKDVKNGHRSQEILPHDTT